MKAIIEISDNIYENLKQSGANPFLVPEFYDIEKAIVNSTPLPDNATNGDVIKTLFDIREIEEMKCCVFVTIYPDYNTRFIKEWWNAPYKENEE